MNKKKCFTLVEILAVVAISGILLVGTAVGVNTLWQNNRVENCLGYSEQQRKGRT